MSKIIISTQIYENYAAHDWDGVNPEVCPEYWKSKGGNDYAILNFKGNEDDATKQVMSIREQIETDNYAYREQIINYQTVNDNYMTEYEKYQMKYEGSIKYPTKVISL